MFLVYLRRGLPLQPCVSLLNDRIYLLMKIMRPRRRPVPFSWSDLLRRRVVFSLTGRCLPWLAGVSLFCLGGGFFFSLLEDLHGVSQLGVLNLPAAWLATLLLLVIGFWSALGLILGRSIPLMLAQALVPTGGLFTFLALWSGALWARAVYGVWWVANPQQVAELLLFGVYLIMLFPPVLFADPLRADRLVAVLAILGVSLVPMVFFAMEWWMLFSGEAAGHALITSPNLIPAMVLVGVGFWCYATYVGLVRLRCMIKERQFGLAGFVFRTDALIDKVK